MDQVPDGLHDAIGDYLAQRISRRALLKRAGVLGLTAAAVGPLVATGATGATPRRGTFEGRAKIVPKSGGRFREGYDRIFTPPDPVSNYWADPDFNALWESLVIRNPEGGIVPMLADTFSSGPTGWTFHLRKGLKFQSGAPCTPAVVVEDFNLYRSTATGQNWPFWVPVTKVSASGQDVMCSTTHPYQAFQETVSTEYSYIIDPVTWKADGSSYGTKAVNGTGPFILTSFSPSVSVVASRWDDYPGSIVPFFQNKGKAYLDEIEWVSLADASERVPQIQTGLVDAIKNPPPQGVDTCKDNPNLVVLEFQELSNFFLSVNMGVDALGFNDLRVRQAISHAIDRQAIVDSIFLGHAVATYGPVFDKYKWYNPAVAKYNRFNVGLAESLLDDAGWKKGSSGVRTKNGKPLSFKAYNQTDETQNQVMEAMSQMLATVGIDMAIESVSQADFSPIRVNPKTTAYAFKWLWSSPIDVSVLFVKFFQHQSSALTPLYNAYNAWQKAGTIAELKSTAYAFQSIFAETVPLIPILTPNTIWVHTNNVVGWQPNQANLYPFYNDVWLRNA
jgi:peptide/nickel transport system substrate-binding protein